MFNQKIILLLQLVTLIHALNMTLHDYDDPSVDHISDAEIINDLFLNILFNFNIDLYNFTFVIFF